MRRRVENRQWQNLDMVEITMKKQKNKKAKSVFVLVYSSFYIERRKFFLCREDNRYASQGMLEKVWRLIEEGKIEDALLLVENLFSYHYHSSEVYFARFVIALERKENAYPYLKRSLEEKKDHSFDREFSLYLKIYEAMELEDDVSLLEDFLTPVLQVPAFGKNSYQGKYQEMVESLPNVKKARKNLESCLHMRPDSLHLKVVEHLLDSLELRQKEIESKKSQLEKELEEERIAKFLQAIEKRNLPQIKESLNKILSYREVEGKDNYIYHLFLELVSMMETLLSDSTFELLPVSYTYLEKEPFDLFLEAISVGDLKYALEIGKKCKGKALDKEHKKVKVSSYLSLLTYFFDILEEKEKETDSFYDIFKGNIWKGNYLHAKEFYLAHQGRLVAYHQRIVLTLLDAGIALQGKVEPKEQIHEQISLPLEEPPATTREMQEVLPLEIEEEEEEEPSKDPLEPIVEVQEEKVTEEPFYPVEPLLLHSLPKHEFFDKFLRYYQSYQLEEARYALTQYDQLLHANQIEKRLDQFYYLLELAEMDRLEDPTIYAKKEEAYAYAYNAYRNMHYENALAYLEYYEKLDHTNNQKGKILRGYIYQKMGKYQEAIASYIEANTISPNPDAYYFLGEIYYLQKRYQEAIFCYLTYNEFYPKENISVYLNLSECYRKTKHFMKVLKYLRLAEEINQEQALGYHLSGRILKSEWLFQRQQEKRVYDQGNKEGNLPERE